jgi:hypothetical protein
MTRAGEKEIPKRTGAERLREGALQGTHGRDHYIDPRKSSIHTGTDGVAVNAPPPSLTRTNYESKTHSS